MTLLDWPRRRLALAALALIAFTLLAHLPILANPGFYSHDEWERLDVVRAQGLLGAVRSYVQLQAGAEFGHPVRPIGLIQQSLSALFLERAPIIPHLFDVLLHALVAVILLAALVDAGLGARLALATGLIFAASPLTTMATGWTGASFDQWYTLFGILACWAAFRMAAHGVSFTRAAGLFAAASGAILSKETALALPGAILLAMALTAFTRDRVHILAGAGAMVIAAVPVVAYLALRASALEASVTGSGDGYYAPSLAFVAHNAVAYFAFPFMPHASDFPAVANYASVRMLPALALHGLLVVGVGTYAGWRFAGIYLLAFFVFLVPVLPLRTLASHYLYGAGPPMALATAVVVQGAWRRRHRLAGLAVVAGAVLMFGNTMLIQGRLYLDGVCQSAFLVSIEARLRSPDAAAAAAVAVSAEPDARVWVIRRALHGRAVFRDAGGRPRVGFADGTPAHADVLQLRADRQCRVH